MSSQSQINLPADYRTSDIIAYHLRDPEQTSERWHNGILYIGLSWQGQPACLALHFKTDHIVLRLDDNDPSIDMAHLEPLVRKILGLNQDIHHFERSAMQHPELGPLIAQQRGLRVPVSTTPFEALVWAILGQQISVRAAVSIRRRFIQSVGQQHHNGLWCHPDAPAVAATSAEVLRQAGLSTAKTATLLTVSQAIAEGKLMFSDRLDTQSAHALQEQLLTIRGIGPWTADYTLLRGYGWLDGSLHGDAAVRRSLRTLLQKDEALSADYTRNWLAAFSPWRALAAAHLWAALRVQA